jgi:hypothetical protein
MYTRLKNYTRYLLRKQNVCAFHVTNVSMQQEDIIFFG